ncbi:MAG: sigma-70 family RNA polymerase sigma factor [Verrucomicrobiales bacterium]|nr:sigma-70 family RNA polymerase sigma factor [Verrucomicrobiales bacterium]
MGRLPETGREAAEAGLVALVRRYRDGDQAAFTRLVEQCAERVFQFLFRYTGHVQDAEDLAQETFLKAYRSLPRFDVSRRFLPWLFTIARRTALNHRRHQRSHADETSDLIAETPEGNPANALANRDDSALLWQWAHRLKPKQYEALCLCYGEGLTAVEAASVMRTSPIHIKVLLHRARLALLEKARRTGMILPPPNP